MAKPLAGRKAFEAMGRSARSRGLSMSALRSMRQDWPLWARQAYAAGWIVQGPLNSKVPDYNGDTK